MTKRMLIMLVCVGVLLAAIVGFNRFKANMIEKALANNATPPATVSAMEVAFDTWQPKLSSVGSLRAVQGVDVTAEVAGLVRDVKFESGQQVKEGQVLVQLNAEAEKAQLHALEAAAKLASLNYERDKKQFKAKAVSRSTIDADIASLKSKRAQVARQSALVDKKTIRAPFTGRLGISTITEGRYLSPGESFVSLQRTDPIYIDFWVPQKNVAKLAIGQTIVATVDAYPKQKFTGKLTAINPAIDKSTRNLRVEATLPNPGMRLRPGMFAHVDIKVGGTRKYLTLPQTAITYNPYGSSVFLVNDSESADKPVAKQVFVTTGPTRGDQVAVLSGIEIGDRVVTSGQLKLRNGTPLIIDNSVQPSNEPHPTPQEGVQDTDHSTEENAAAGQAAVDVTEAPKASGQQG